MNWRHCTQYRITLLDQPPTLLNITLLLPKDKPIDSQAGFYVVPTEGPNLVSLGYATRNHGNATLNYGNVTLNYGLCCAPSLLGS